WRAHQDADADAGDVGAGEVREASVRQPPEHELRGNRHGDREPGSGIALENAERQVSADQDPRDEDRPEKAVVERERPGHSGSTMRVSASILGASIAWRLPDGHRIATC